MLSFVAVIVASCSLFLTGHREVAYTLHITDDTCQVVNVFAVTFRTFLQIVLADVAALIADCVRNIECEVVTSFLCSYTEKLCILCLGKMLLEIEVKSGSSSKMLDILAAVQTHLVNDIERLVLYDIEVAVVAVTRNEIAVFPIPLRMLYAYILRRNHLAVEKGCL